MLEPLADGLDETDHDALSFVVVLRALDAHRLTGDAHQVVSGVLKQLFEVSQDENTSLPLVHQLAEENRLPEPRGQDNQRRPVRLQVPETGLSRRLLVVP